MNTDIVQIVRDMGVFDQGIFLVLVVMALASLIIFVERLIAFSLSRRSSRRFASVAAQLLEKNEHRELLSRATNTRSSHLASLLAAGLKTFLHQQVRAHGKVSPIELTRRELLRKTEALGAELRRGMNVLASVGSVAPFVGLLGTVMGIIHSFTSIAQEGSGGLGTVSAGISQALVVTAAGLVVAIPAVLAFNYLSGKSDELLRGLDLARGEFLDALENEFGHQRDNGARAASETAEAGAQLPLNGMTNGHDAREAIRV